MSVISRQCFSVSPPFPSIFPLFSLWLSPRRIFIAYRPPFASICLYFTTGSDRMRKRSIKSVWDDPQPKTWRISRIYSRRNFFFHISVPHPHPLSFFFAFLRPGLWHLYARIVDDQTKWRIRNCDGFRARICPFLRRMRKFPFALGIREDSFPGKLFLGTFLDYRSPCSFTDS